MSEAPKCTVVNCVYNEDYICTANQIEVNSHGTAMTNTSAETLCKTFKPRSVYRTMGFK
jgi:hypothetical protein